jgi:hypothetical protein
MSTRRPAPGVSTTTPSQRDALTGQAVMIMRSAEESVEEENDLNDIRRRFDAAMALLAGESDTPLDGGESSKRCLQLESTFGCVGVWRG